MNWRIHYLLDNAEHFQMAVTSEQAVDLARRLIAQGRQVLSIKDIRGQGSSIYGAEIQRICASRQFLK